MTCKVLTTQIASICDLTDNYSNILKNAKDGAVAILIENSIAFYALTPKRLAQLLEMETYILYSVNDVTLDNQLFEEKSNTSPVKSPMGKFAMYSEWKPDADFQRMAALWGISLKQPVTTEELAAFISYWQAEGKVFHHIQWQQKLARSIYIGRNNNNQFKCKVSGSVSEPDKQIPKGFRGAK